MIIHCVIKMKNYIFISVKTELFSFFWLYLIIYVYVPRFLPLQKYSGSHKDVKEWGV